MSFLRFGCSLNFPPEPPDRTAVQDCLVGRDVGARYADGESVPYRTGIWVVPRNDPSLA